jgi:hypothetical protein
VLSYLQKDPNRKLVRLELAPKCKVALGHEFPPPSPILRHAEMSAEVHVYYPSGHVSPTGVRHN